MMKLLKKIIEAVLNQGEDHKASRVHRRTNARNSGRMNPDGKYFGGVLPKKEKKLERYLAGKCEL